MGRPSLAHHPNSLTHSFGLVQLIVFWFLSDGTTRAVALAMRKLMARQFFWSFFLSVNNFLQTGQPSQPFPFLFPLLSHSPSSLFSCPAAWSSPKTSKKLDFHVLPTGWDHKGSLAIVWEIFCPLWRGTCKHVHTFPKVHELSYVCMQVFICRIKCLV